MKLKEVLGLLSVTTKTDISILEAIIWRCLDKLTDFLII
jgi:hypothetical protein